MRPSLLLLPLFAAIAACSSNTPSSESGINDPPSPVEPPGGGNGDGDGSGRAGTGGSESVEPVSTCTPPLQETAALADVPGDCTADSGELVFETAQFCVHLEESTQTLSRLIPKGDPSFDFAPSDRADDRQGDGYAQLGDVTLRTRSGGTSSWQNAASFVERAPINAVPPEDAVDSILSNGQYTVHAAAHLEASLSAAPGLLVERQWGNQDGRLTLRFHLTNPTDAPIEVGGLGFPMVFNNIISGRDLEEAHARCSFADPYIGGDGGYLQVTRLKGEGSALLVLPELGTSFEAYNPMLNEPAPDSTDATPLFVELTPRNQTFEGFHEWMVHSGAYAETEWQGVSPWNEASTVTIEPGQSIARGFRFVLSDSIRTIEDTLIEENRPVAVGVPGYIIPRDIEARLFLHSPLEVTGMEVEPAGALNIVETSSTEECWRAYTITSNGSGRARLTVSYADGKRQTIHYNLIDPAAESVAKMGQFLTTEAWFDEPDDPFGRSPAVHTYDREENGIVLQDERAWVCGLGDDGGATWLAGIMKLSGQPDAAQIEQYERFVDDVVWGGLQYSEGPNQFGVKRTLFYYEPGEMPAGYYDPAIDWTTWAAWSRAHTEQVPRSYNYPHVAALYWTLYRLARNTVGLVTHHSWDWYLRQAYETSVAMTTVGSQYAEFGVMDGSVFLEILKDLQREEWSSEASDLEARMKERADHWATLAYPFGSEMAWDSTGQEEVYMWSKYFDFDDKAEVTLNAILGYMPSIPHWGYHGSARRYWDFIYGGAKIDRLERMLHHYGSSLNAIPVLAEYRDNPDDFHLLRIGHAGMMGPLSNIDEIGFPSMAFHAFADTLEWEARTGDYGLAFYGHAAGTGSYFIEHPEFGWLAFGGNVSTDWETGEISLTPLDSFRKRVYLAPLGLWLTLDAGEFESLKLPADGSAATVRLAAATNTAAARLRIERPGSSGGPFIPTEAPATERGAYVIPLSDQGAAVELTAAP